MLRSLQSYSASFLSHDLVAGLTLVAIAIPEQLATARLGGFSPQIGFFAFLAGSLAFALFGSNRFLSSGADSTITPIFAGGLALLATSGSPDYVALAGALALMVGLVLVIGGIFRLGWIADLLSIPVTVGFLAGISLHILISQLPAILGLPTPGGPMLQRLATLAEQLHPRLPIFAAEVVWAARHEMARTVEDILGRRTRALFLDAQVALDIAPRVAGILAGELERDDAWVEHQLREFNALAARYRISD